MDKRVAVLSIIVEDQEQTESLNRLLHQHREFVVGRMGLPYPAKDICIISVALDAPQDVISALSGKIGRLPGVSSKTTFAQV